MKKTSLSAALYVALVFVSGVAVGGFSHWLYASNSVSATVRRPSPEEYRRKYVAEMETRLKLDEEQVKQLQTILDQTLAVTTEYVVSPQIVPTDIARDRALQAVARDTGERVVSLLLDRF